MEVFILKDEGEKIHTVCEKVISSSLAKTYLNCGLSHLNLLSLAPPLLNQYIT